MRTRVGLGPPVVLLIAGAALSSGCWARVRSTAYVAPTAAGGGEVHGVYVARPGVPVGAAGSSASGALGIAGAVPGSTAWLPGASTSGDVVSSLTAGSAAIDLVAGVEPAPGDADAPGSGSGSAFASATAGWRWSAAHGWTRTGDAAGSTASTVAAAGSATAVGVSTTVGGSGATGTLGTDATVALPLPPRRGGATATTGAGARLSALATVGVTVSGCACSVEGEVAALSPLVPLGGADLGAGAVVLGDEAISIELAPAHDVLGMAGGATSIAIRLRGGAAPVTPPPLRVHLVIDASTSMRSRWGDVKDAALTLVRRLRPEDELQIVVYGDGATVALAPSLVGDGRAARAVIRALRCGGRTNIEAGLRAAYDASVSDGSMVLLLSDGVPLGGAATPGELGALAAAARETHGVTTFAIGLGTEFHAGILYALATAGGGDFRIAPGTAELDAILAGALAAHGRIVARDVALDLALPPGVTLDASATLDARIDVRAGTVHIGLPTVAAGSSEVVIVPVLAVGGTTQLAAASAAWSASGARGTATGVVRIAAGADEIVSGGIGLALDVELGAVLHDVASLTENGDGAGARVRVDAHAAHVEAIASAHADAALTVRARASRALGLELERLVPDASHAERRQTSAAILEWSLSLGR